MARKTHNNKVIGAQKTKFSREIHKKKDTFQARLAFYLSLGFWVPLFNVGLSVVAIIIAIKALMRMQKNPQLGGQGYAIAALVLGFATAIGSIVFLFVYLFQRLTCEVVPTLF